MRTPALVLAVALAAVASGAAAAAPYAVRPGDTLYSVASAFGTTVAELQRLNGLGGTDLKAGQTIVVPDPPEPAPAAERRHTVAAGETLYRIAARYGTSVPALQGANGLTGDALKVGQVLVVPDGGQPATTGAQIVTTGTGLPAPAVAGLPPLGEPPPPPTARSAPVPSGRPAAPARDRLDLPPAAAPLPPLAAPGPAAPPPAVPGESPALLHTVAAGETLYGLSRHYGVDPAAIRSLSGLSGDAIAVGQLLRVPVVAARPAAPGTAGPRAVAERYLGVAYRYGGTTPSGLDCSGFTGLVMAELGVELPRTSQEQFAIGTPVDRAELLEGDLVFFDTVGAGRVSHVGISLGGNEFVHAATFPAKVIVSRLDEPYYATRFLGARRVLASPAGAD